MEKFTTLAMLLPGESGRVRDVQTQELLRRRLLELGFAPGERVRCLFSSSAGDPAAYLVRGTVIALRRVDANRIFVDKEA